MHQLTLSTAICKSTCFSTPWQPVLQWYLSAVFMCISLSMNEAGRTYFHTFKNHQDFPFCEVLVHIICSFYLTIGFYSQILYMFGKLAFANLVSVFLSELLCPIWLLAFSHFLNASFLEESRVSKLSFNKQLSNGMTHLAVHLAWLQ